MRAGAESRPVSSDNFPFKGITLTRYVEIIRTRVKEYLADHWKSFRSRVYTMSHVILNLVISATATFSWHHNFGSRAPVVDDERAVSRRLILILIKKG